MIEDENGKDATSYLTYIQTKLDEDKALAKKEGETHRRYRNASIIATLFAGVLIASLFIFDMDPYVREMALLLFFAMLAGCLLALVINFLYKKPTAQEKYDIAMLEDEVELHKLRSEDEKFVAEKQFRNHQKELKRYYDLNISQIKFLSGLGIVLIVIGVAIVISTIVVYGLTNLSETPIAVDTHDLVYVVSISCGILLNFIGAFFIKMYSQNMEVAISLHSKLAGSNDLLLVNLIVSKITDNILRESSLAEISKIIAASGNDKT